MTKHGGWPATGFGKRLRELREVSGLTQRQLADKAGCHYMTLAKLEQGTQEPAWPLVVALCQALGVSCDAFQQAAGRQREPQSRPRGRPPNTEVAATDPLAQAEVHPDEDQSEAMRKRSRGRRPKQRGR
jgi:transcriptional regulator with XRE-family HTH domain